jgi:putative ABC transport system substrate-binding protein
MSYGATASEIFTIAAEQTAKVLLEGARASELPLQQATCFELVINQKTAKALGLTIPHSLLLRAGQVIE